jgi:hypothetical protein
MRLTFLIVLIAAIGFVTTPRAQGGVDGTWAFTFETPMGMLDATATFKSNGEELTGTMTSQIGSTDFKGTVKGSAINFIMNVSTPDGDAMVSVSGELEGDAMKGTFDFGAGAGNWSAKRSN